MKGKKKFIYSFTGALTINLMFVLAIRLFPQIVYGYASASRLSIDYPSLSESESVQRRCLISRYSAEAGLEGFLEYHQGYWKGETINSKSCLYFVLDCRNNPSLQKEQFSEPPVIARIRKHVVFEIWRKDGQVVSIPDSLILKRAEDIIIFRKISE